LENKTIGVVAALSQAIFQEASRVRINPISSILPCSLMRKYLGLASFSFWNWTGPGTRRSDDLFRASFSVRLQTLPRISFFDTRTREKSIL